MLALLYRLVALDDDEATAQRTTLFLIGSPLGFSFLLPYTESLLLLSIVAALYAARRGRWWLAGAAGGAAALTKQLGVVVVLPLLWELWQQHRNAVRIHGGASAVWSTGRTGADAAGAAGVDHLSYNPWRCCIFVVQAGHAHQRSTGDAIVC